MTFKEMFDKLKGTNKGRLLAMGLILLLNTAIVFLIIFVFFNACLMVLLIPVTIFGILYLFGERSLKWFILLGLVVLLLTSLILGAVVAYQYYGYDYPPLEGKTSDGVIVLQNGNVNPHGYTDSGIYNYTVTYFDQVDIPLGIWVNINNTALKINETHEMKPVDSGVDTASGKKYYFKTQPLAEGIWLYRFIVQNSSGAWANTTGGFDAWEMGPINIPLTQFLLFGLMDAPFLAMIYLLFIMLYWWTQKAKTYQPRPPPVPKEEEAEFTCSKCNADVPADATKCPKCGEEFEEDEDEKLKEKIEKGQVYCKVCMNTIRKGDMLLGCQCGRTFHLKCAQRVGKCPSCGTEFKQQ